MENSNKINLLEQVPQLPCSRVVNGFRIECRFVDEAKKDYRVLWFIRPNRSNQIFHFVSLEKAMYFAKGFVNRHTDKFWFSIWSPVHSFSFVKGYLK